MASFIKDNPDLLYYLDRGIDWGRLAELAEHGFRQPDGHRDAGEARAFYRDIVDMVGELVAEEVAPLAAEVDRQGARLEGGEAVLPPSMEALFRKLAGLDLHGMCLPRELGGLNCPLTLYFLATELFARADVSMMSHYAFHGAMAIAMLNLSMMEGTTRIDPDTGVVQETRFRDEIAEIASGRAWGSMDITEPDAGSDMAALRAVGRQEPDGSWTVTGQKIFITSGHGKYHFVIARTEPEAEGLAGLSMFLVPAYRDEGGVRTRLATVDRVEEKLGHHGSVTAAITFDRTPAHLVGRRGDGFRFMLKLMNGARVAVGFESIGLCEAAYRLARDYAAGRPSMGKTIDRHEMIADYLDEMRTDIEGLRALAVCGAVEEETAQRLIAAGREDEARPHQERSRRVTPLLKYLAAEKAVEMARRALQIHGGNGYTTEYGAEKLLRDALVMPIYEGTSQIQALMAMKDTLAAVMRDPQGFVARTAKNRWRQVSARDPLERGVVRLEGLALRAQRHLITRTATDKLRSLRGQSPATWPGALRRNWNPKRDFASAMLHAERLTRLLADTSIAEVLWEQARKHPERRDVLERYLERAEPRCRFLVDEITTTGARLLAELAGRDEPEKDETGERADDQSSSASSSSRVIAAA